MTEDLNTIKQKIVEAYQSGVLNEDEYRNKMRQLEAAGKGTQAPNVRDILAQTNKAEDNSANESEEDDGIYYFGPKPGELGDDSIKFVTPDTKEHVFKGSYSKGKKKGKRIIIAIAIIVIAIIGFKIITGLGGSGVNSEESGDPVYTYRYNEWNLYVAKRLSDSVIKVEKWGRVVADDDKYPFEYEKDLKTITINEDNNSGFNWIDKDKVSFNLDLKDSEEEGLAKTVTVPFVKTTNQFVTSANYTDVIYTFNLDRWNMYVASKLTDSIIKIEKWETFVANDDEYPFEYKRDICVVNTMDSDTDFAWLDDAESSFIMSFSDKTEDELKKSSKQTFTKRTDFKKKYHLSTLKLPSK